MKSILLFLFAAIVLAGCQSGRVTGETVSSAAGKSYRNVTADELHGMLKSKDLPFVHGGHGEHGSFLPFHGAVRELRALRAQKEDCAELS